MFLSNSKRRRFGLSEETKLALRKGSWPESFLISGSEKGRHIARIQALFLAAQERRILNEHLINIGPGAVVSLFRNLLIRPSSGAFLLPKKVLFHCIRLLECTLRQRMEMSSLYSYEPQEIIEVLMRMQNLNIVKYMTIVDRDVRVLNAAKSSIENLETPISFDLQLWNLNEDTQWPGEKAGLVCVYKCLHLCAPVNHAVDQLETMLKPGALLSTTFMIQRQSFQVIDKAHGLFEYVP